MAPRATLPALQQGHLAENVMHFARVLRAAGLPIGPDRVLDAVRAADEAAGVVLVVGHEPAMSRTAGALAGLGSDEATYARIQLGVPTASWSVLKLTGAWSDLARGGARLERLHVPAR